MKKEKIFVAIAIALSIIACLSFVSIIHEILDINIKVEFAILVVSAILAFIFSIFYLKCDNKK